MVLFAAVLPGAQEPRFMVGVAEVKITPPVGTPMAGFSARQGPSRGVHDDLFVKTLVVSGGKTAVALVTCEVIGVNRALVEEIRRRAARQTGLSAGGILIAATHTHSGPVLEGEYQDFFVRSAVESTLEAWRARRPRKLGSGVAGHRGWVGMNRRRLESGFSPVDKEIQVLKVADSRGRVEAVLFNYPCHPACLGPDNLLISADWPHFATQRLTERLGKAVKVLYFQGSSGLQTLDAHRRAVRTLVDALKPFRNWHLDLANERSVRDRRFVSFAELRLLRDAAKRLDPQRLVCASDGSDIGFEGLRGYLLTVQADFACPHRPRNSQSPRQTEAKTRDYLASMKQIGRIVPVHYQEPFRRGYPDWQPTAGDYATDAHGAKTGGAAGLCFHNGQQKDGPGGAPRRSFDLRQAGLFEQLDPEERKALEELRLLHGSRGSGR